MQEKFLYKELSSNKDLYIGGFLLLIACIVFMPKTGHSWDTYCWELWSALIQKHSLASVYLKGSPVNYLPLYMYVLKLYTMVFSNAELHDNIFRLKYAAVFFDIGTLIVLFRMLPKSNYRVLLLLLAFANPAFTYNSLFWNQVDGILSFFIFISVLAAQNRKPVLASMAYLLALNFKLQALIYFPLLILLILPQLNGKLIVKIILFSVCAELLIIFPFLKAGNALNILDVVSGSVDFYPALSMNAFNFWHLFYEGDLMFTPDDQHFFLGLSAKSFGLILFFLFSGILLLAPAFKVYRHFRSDIKPEYNQELLFITAALIACFFFYFNTQMHERYIHPMLIFSTALAFLYKRYFQWIVFSIAYALSLESICRFSGNLIPQILFHPKFLAVLFGIAISLLIYHWVKLQPFKKDY